MVEPVCAFGSVPRPSPPGEREGPDPGARDGSGRSRQRHLRASGWCSCGPTSRRRPPFLPANGWTKAQAGLDPCGATAARTLATVLGDESCDRAPRCARSACAHARAGSPAAATADRALMASSAPTLRPPAGGSAPGGAGSGGRAPSRGDKATKKALRGSSLLLVGRGISVLANFATQVLIVRHLSKADFGVFAYALSIVAMGQSVAALGVDRAVSRFVPMYDEHREDGKLLGTLAVAIGTILLLGLACVCLVAGFGDLLAASGTERLGRRGRHGAAHHDHPRAAAGAGQHPHRDVRGVLQVALDLPPQAPADAGPAPGRRHRGGRPWRATSRRWPSATWSAARSAWRCRSCSCRASCARPGSSRACARARPASRCPCARSSPSPCRSSRWTSCSCS